MRSAGCWTRDAAPLNGKTQMTSRPSAPMPAPCLAVLLSLATRMRAFAQAAAEPPNDGATAFLPRRGDGTGVHARQPSGRRGAPRRGMA